MEYVTRAPATLPAGQRIYAIGDVHGCADRLSALHARIEADLTARPAACATVVHLGDYVDRGPASAAVIAALLQRPRLGRAPVINLRGNHEEMMLWALGGADVELWLQNGGAASLRSWGVPPGVRPAKWAQWIPAQHMAFLKGLRLSWAAGPYLFAHAGIRPGIRADLQSAADLLWIREPFLSSADDFGVVVVHGHTPQAEPVVRPNRIGIDTGAVLGGKLTCAVLEEDRVAFLFA